MDQSLLEYLAAHPLFKNINIDELKSISRLISEETYPLSATIFLEEEEAIHFYILKTGSLRAFIGGKMLASIQPGQIFGEIAVLNGSIRTGSVMAAEKSDVIRINGKELLNGDSVPVGISFRILRELIKPLTSLYYTNDFYKRTRDIIRQGEGDKVEFKSSLRFNLHSGKFGREIEHAALKTIAAFLNSWGGILIIGVDDSGTVLGTKNDQFENDDKAVLHLTNLVKERMGTHFLQFISSSVEMLGEDKIMRIDVSPSNLPAYLTNNNEEYFYIRTGPATTDLKPSRIYDYIENRFFRPRA